MPRLTIEHDLPGGRVHVAFTDAADGDLRVDAPDDELERRRGRLSGHPYAWVRQVHGTRVVHAHDESVAGREGDALVTTRAGLTLAVHVADCVPVALVGAAGRAVGVIHAGWRGLAGGVIEASVAAVRAAGETQVVAHVGPCICVAHYAFGVDLLDGLAADFGPGVRGRTTTGEPALDLRRTAVLALERAGAVVGEGDESCTAEPDQRLWSHRARGDLGRQAVLVWREESS